MILISVILFIFLCWLFTSVKDLWSITKWLFGTIIKIICFPFKLTIIFIKEVVKIFTGTLFIFTLCLTLFSCVASKQSTYNNLSKNIVMIRDNNYFGTGFVFDSVIVTCNHLMKDDNAVITFIGGEVSNGKLIARDTINDIAILSATFPDYVYPMHFALLSPIGADLICIGHPNGFPYLLSLGYASSKITKLPSGNFQMASLGGICLGSSGSPVFNKRGELVGMVQMYSSKTHLTIMINTSSIIKFIKRAN